MILQVNLHKILDMVLSLIFAIYQILNRPSNDFDTIMKDQSKSKYDCHINPR